MSAPKKMRMERLSPIVEVEVQKKVSTRCSTPPKAVSSLKKDVYAIEMTSSPETGEKQPPKASPMLIKPRRRWRESKVKRPKSKTAGKNTISTPLSYFISRSTVQPQQNFAPDPSPKAQLLVTPKNDLHPVAEVRTVEGTPVIDDFSPPKNDITSHLITSVVKSHLGFLIGKPSSSDSKYTPLSGIVVRKSVGHNRSLNDPVDNINPVDVDSDDDNCEKDANDLSASIETIPSPEQQSNRILLSSSLLSAPKSFKSGRNKLDDSMVRGKKVYSSSGEMCGVERKKPKRSLNFGSHPMKSIAAISEAVENVSYGRAPLVIEPHDDDNLHESDCDSVVEGTPKSHKKIDDNDGLCGFTQCSKTSSDWDFPIKRSQLEHQDTMTPVKWKVPNPAVIDDASVDSPPHAFRLSAALISDDETSSDQSNDVIQDEPNDVERKVISRPGAEVIDDPDTHPLKFDVTKKSIQSIDSPVKKMFSEAVNIEAVYSPESHEVMSVIDLEETFETTTTTQENEIEESEDVRPRKRLKKGTLVEQAAGVISRIKASQKLFEYEVKAKLCPSSKKSQVSTQLVVCHKWTYDVSTVVHICKPLKRMNAGEYADAERSLLVCILANKASLHIPVGAVVVIHFPVTVIICSRMPYVLAGSKLVLQSSHPGERVSGDRTLHSLISLPKVDFTDEIMPVKDVQDQYTGSLRVFLACTLKSVVDATFSQALVDEIVLKLEIAHVVCARDTKKKTVSAFCFDEDCQPCLIEFRKVHDVKRAKALEMLHILDDGVHVEAKNFVVVGQKTMSDKLKSIFSHSFGGAIGSDVVYILTPCEADWVIVSSGGMRTYRKATTKFSDMPADENCGKRHLVKIFGVESRCGDLFVKDSDGCSLKLCCWDENFKNRCRTLTPPFKLDGVLFRNKDLHSDEYTTVKTVKNA